MTKRQSYVILNPMSDRRFLIDQLCELSGFSRRTIRYYIQIGLLDPPAGRGRGGFYYDSHLSRLREIRALQERGLKIAAIQEVIGTGAVPEPPPQRDVWARYQVVPGVEMHVSTEVEGRARVRLIEALRAARSILEKGGQDDE